MLKYQKCENCGAELVETKEGKYHCKYCKHLYTDQTLERAYEKASKSLRATVKEVVNESFLNAKIEKVANCRQGLYNARTSEYINPQDVKYWSEQILKILPEDPQATFFLIASSKRWQDLNEFLKTFDAKTNAHLLDGFVDYLTNGQFVETCLLRLMDLIATYFNENTNVYKICHKKIADASKSHDSGMFDENLPRDVFVAYSSKDKEKAYEIVEYLEYHGLKCYISMRNLPKGVDSEQYYETRLKRAIDNCQVFLFISSKNSRSRACDAYSVEMAYVKERDLKKCDNEYYYKSNYDLYFEKYRTKCKPRVEWLLDRYGDTIYEGEVKKFFKGLSWCVDKETVLSTVKGYVLNTTSFEEETGYTETSTTEKHETYDLKNDLHKYANALKEDVRIKLEQAREKAEQTKKKVENSFDTWETKENSKERERKKIRFFLCLFLGIFGVHKFYEKNVFMGIVYLCTYGLCGIGWIIDIIECFKAMNKD